jgi:hypothetical protein
MNLHIVGRLLDYLMILVCLYHAQVMSEILISCKCCSFEDCGALAVTSGRCGCDDCAIGTRHSTSCQLSAHMLQKQQNAVVAMLEAMCNRQYACDTRSRPKKVKIRTPRVVRRGGVPAGVICQGLHDATLLTSCICENHRYVLSISPHSMYRMSSSRNMTHKLVQKMC